MLILTLTLLLIFTAAGNCEFAQVKCSYKDKPSNLERIWCKRDSDDQNCCTGFYFSSGVRELDDGQVKVHDDGSAFTMSVMSLSQGDGVYWCGLRNSNDTIIKLNEINLHRSQHVVWSIGRWILFALLLFTLIFIHIYSSSQEKQKKKYEAKY